jgi:hypothetical protein
VAVVGKRRWGQSRVRGPAMTSMALGVVGIRHTGARAR